MENRNIIIALLLVIAVLAIFAGIMFTQTMNAKEPTKLKITSNNTIYKGDKISFKLTDVNGTPIANQTINVSIIAKDGSVNHKSVKTNEKGKATLKIDKNSGNYSINCSYDGNDKYANTSAFKKIEIQEEVEDTGSYQTDSYSTESYSSQSSSEDYRPAVDSSGITREHADKYGWEYTTEHGGHYVGPLDHWDEKAGMYHD